MKAMIRSLALSALLVTSLIGCGGEDGENNATSNNTTTPMEKIAVAPATAQSIAADATVDYTLSGLLDSQAYRITLVVADNVTVSGTSGTFVDNDENGAADAGASENVALITRVNGADQTGAKTVPGGMDDPAAPSGVFPKDGVITLTIQGVGAGTVHPVVYHNGGASTFLELDAAGKPTESYVVGSAITVQ